jgi:hypothetical protein
VNPLIEHPPLAAARRIKRYDHVRVPDGRIGQVIGFYRDAEDEPMLVRFVSGDSQRYGRADLRLIT